MYMPEVGMSISTSDSPASLGEAPASTAAQKREGKEQQLETVVADQLNRRRIHLPPASNEEQRKRIMEVLARIQSYFGSSIENLIQPTRTTLPPHPTFILVPHTSIHTLLNSL